MNLGNGRYGREISRLLAQDRFVLFQGLVLSSQSVERHRKGGSQGCVLRISVDQLPVLDDRPIAFVHLLQQAPDIRGLIDVSRRYLLEFSVLREGLFILPLAFVDRCNAGIRTHVLRVGCDQGLILLYCLVKLLLRQVNTGDGQVGRLVLRADCLRLVVIDDGLIRLALPLHDLTCSDERIEALGVDVQHLLRLRQSLVELLLALQ